MTGATRQVRLAHRPRVGLGEAPAEIAPRRIVLKIHKRKRAAGGVLDLERFIVLEHLPRLYKRASATRFCFGVTVEIARASTKSRTYSGTGSPATSHRS